jgi:glycerol uptake facilitator-like aquaporin
VIAAILAGVVLGSRGGGHDWRFLWVLIVAPLIARRIANRPR